MAENCMISVVGTLFGNFAVSRSRPSNSRPELVAFKQAEAFDLHAAQALSALLGGVNQPLRIRALFFHMSQDLHLGVNHSAEESTLTVTIHDASRRSR